MWQCAGTMFLVSSSFANAQTLTKEQATEIAGLILSLESFQKYSGTFLPKTASYDPKTKAWSVDAYGGLQMSFPESPAYFFYIRDSDGSFRLGYIGALSMVPKSSAKFRAHPTVQRRFKQLTGK